MGMLSVLSLLASCGSQQTQSRVSPAIDFAAMDTTVAPTEDFYRYVNGSWMRNNPLPSAYSRYGAFDILADSARVDVRHIIEDIRKQKQQKGSNEYFIATLYNQAMDSTQLNKLSAEPLLRDLKVLQAIASKEELINYVAQQDQEYGSSLLFGSYVAADEKNSSINILHLSQVALSLGPRGYYLEQDEAMRNIRSEYLKYLAKVIALAGYSEQDALRMAHNKLKLETELAQISYSQVELRDTERNYNITNIPEFAQQYRGFDWLSYFEKRGLAVDQANFAQLDFLKKFDAWFAQVAIEDLRDKLIADIIDSSSSSLSDEFMSAYFDFYGRVISGRKEMKPRWERAVQLVNQVLGEAVGKVYVARYFSSEAKERMLTLVANLQKALAKRMEDLEWMSQETKVRALDKLNNFTVKIGYPNKWKDYSSLAIDESQTYYENLKAAARFAQADNIKDLGKPVDKSRWLMNPQEVNAYYMPTTNEICFPAAILQPPFFNVYADDAVNYGAIGVVIGHEMTHGFDDQGSMFDKEGNMNNWWTAEDAQKFSESTKRLAEQFSRNLVAPNLYADGELTLGENIADQGGIAVALDALKMTRGTESKIIDGLTAEQRFFIAYARLWGQNINEQEIVRLTKTDPHSLGELRVNQALKNIEAFHQAFKTKSGDKMYLSPEERITVW